MNEQLDSKLYLTAQEAAKTLNISVTSLYSYVSRGLIKSQSTSGSRSKGYLRSDITALKNKKGGAKDDPNFFFAPDLKKGADLPGQTSSGASAHRKPGGSCGATMAKRLIII